jgi:DNA polymerase-3 subunit alpha/error-prone DNA polymerase
LLADVLDETLGIMVYQEDVSKTAVAVAGFSHSDADALRKVLSKKDRAHRLKDHQARFIAGARARGVSEEQIAGIWAMMMSFDGYSFCKPHSASYARVSFQAAYLKRHHPAPFMAAVISNQGGFYGTFAYVSEARRLGLTILPPDVRLSRDRWTGEGRSLRVGLMAIRDLGRATRSRILAAREEGDFRSLEDFLARVRPDETEARALVQCGGCDSLAPGQPRAELLWRAARWARPRGSARPARGPQGQPAAAGELFAEEAAAPRLPPGDERQRLREEFRVLGFLCDRHPMCLYRPEADRAGALPLAVLPSRVGQRVGCAGWLITGKLVSTKHGEPMEFLTFEDETGLVEATFFPNVYKEFCDILDWGHPFLLGGRVEEEFGATTLTVDRVRPLGRREAGAAGAVRR